MDIRQLAFRKACATLSAIGAEFAVKYNGVMQTSTDLQYAFKSKGGTVEGPLAPEALTEPRKPRRSWEFTGYLDAFKILQPGEAWSYQCADKVESVALQAAATGSACKLWGKGNYISHVNAGNMFELLRVS